MKVYLVEHINPQVRKRIEENFIITTRIDDCDIILTRNYLVNKEFLAKCKNAKAVAMYGTGLDTIDLKECERLGITVFNAPYQNSLSVAELIIALMLDISRHVDIALNDTKNGIIDYDKTYGNEISHKKVGIIGLGHIGLAVAKMAHFGFDMDVLGYSKSKKNIAYINEVPLDELLKQSDYVVLAVPANDETIHMINLEKLQLMKKSAYLINGARGSLVNHDDLVRALHEKIIKGYATDVFELEPVAQNDALLKENVFALNHIGANTEEALYRVGMMLVDKMIAFEQNYNKVNKNN